MGARTRIILGAAAVAVAANVGTICMSHPAGGLLWNVLGTNAAVLAVVGFVLLISSLEGS